MKIVGTVFCFCLTLGVKAQLPAFSGAQGAAVHVTGGRGGMVYHVTKLDQNYSDAVVGTLRYGLNDGNFPAGTRRTIVFDVAGVFWLGRYGAERGHFNGWDTQDRYDIGSNITLAGQTAPGPVIIAGGVTKPGKTNVILRNITFAAGYGMRSFEKPDENPPILPTPGDFPDSYVFDALDISGQNLMIDHCTTVYGTDETISCNELANNLTIQFCNISQGQNYPQADAENPGVYTGHALGSLLQAGSSANVSVLNNLYAHLKGRLPRVGSEVGTGPFNDFRNNVFYNWLGTAGSGANGQNSFNNFIGNFYLAGPGGDDVTGTNIIHSNGGTGIFSGGSSTYTRVYHLGNVKDTNKDGDPNDQVALSNSDFGSSSFQGGAYPVNLGVTIPAASAFTNVLRYCGSRWWMRDYDFVLGNTNAITTNEIASYLDERLIHETFTGTGRIMAWADDPFDDDPNEGIEWQLLLALRADTNTLAAPFTRPAGWDTDQDGMPDTWEVEYGLNPNLANNNADFDADGYTDLEEYLNEIAAWPAPGTILFTGESNNRYAEIFNWRVYGLAIPIPRGGTPVTSSLWQPSRFDTALISNALVAVDAVGQHAGTLLLTNSGVLSITNGWLQIANSLNIATSCQVLVSAGLHVTNDVVNHGLLQFKGNAAFSVGGNFTNDGVLDIMTWNGTLPPGLVNTGTILDRSVIVISNCQITGDNFSVTIPSYPGHTYQLQFLDDIDAGEWQPVSPPQAGTGAPLVLEHVAGAIGSQKFYRVAVE